MRRTIKLGVAVGLSLAAAGIAVTSASSSDADHPRTEIIHALAAEDPGTTIPLDLDHSGDDSVGDQLVFSVDLFADGRKIGFDGGRCQLVRAPALFNCVSVNQLPKGQVTAQGLNDFSQGDGPYHFAITGGTGAYRKAHGEVEVLFRSPDPEHSRVTFRIIR